MLRPTSESGSEKRPLGRTINIEVSALRQILREQGRWAHFDGKVKMLRENKDIGRALTDEEVHRLEAAAGKSRSLSLPVAITMLRNTGMRVGELRMMKWAQVNFLAAQVKVGRAKTRASEGRVMPLSESAQRTLLEWRSRFDNQLPDHYIFPSERYGLNGEDGYQKGSVVVWNLRPDKPIGSWKTAWTAYRKAAQVSCTTCVSKLAELR